MLRPGIVAELNRGLQFPHEGIKAYRLYGQVSRRIICRAFQAPNRRRLVAVTSDFPECLMATLKVALVNCPDILRSASGFHMPKASPGTQVCLQMLHIKFPRDLSEVR